MTRNTKKEESDELKSWLGERFSSLENRLESMDSTLTDLRSKLTILESQNVQLTEKLNNVVSEQTQIREEMQFLKDRVAKLEKETNSSEKKMEMERDARRNRLWSTRWFNTGIPTKSNDFQTLDYMWDNFLLPAYNKAVEEKTLKEVPDRFEVVDMCHTLSNGNSLKNKTQAGKQDQPIPNIDEPGTEVNNDNSGPTYRDVAANNFGPAIQLQFRSRFYQKIALKFVKPVLKALNTNRVIKAYYQPDMTKEMRFAYNNLRQMAEVDNKRVFVHNGKIGFFYKTDEKDAKPTFVKNYFETSLKDMVK